MSEAWTQPCCDYCGLPVGGDTEKSTKAYCCYGCRVAAAITSEGGEEGQTRWQLTRLGLAIFFTMNVMVCTLALWSWNVYEDAALASERAGILFDLLRHVSLLLALAVAILLGGPLLENAIEHLRRRSITTDLLIVAGVVAALVYSLVSVVTGGEHTYFEVSCMVLVGVTLGRWFEAVGKLKTTNAIRSLEKLLPTTVRVVTIENNTGINHETVVAIDDVEVSQIIRVLPGERIATDGIITRGQAAVDEKVVTGESTPSIKESGDTVHAGTLNQDGDLLIKVTAPPRGGALLRIVDAVAAAATAKSRLQSIADRVASWFVPGVVVIASITFVAHTTISGIGNGLMAALAVLLIACPCALGIATPLAVWAAMGRATSAGVLFRHGDALQQLASTRVICFDKTGTLTTGDTIVDQLVVDGESSPEELLQRALSLAASSTHAYSAAIRDHAQVRLSDPALTCPDELTTIPGRGLVARQGRSDESIYLGSLALMDEAKLEQSALIREAIDGICAAGKPLACIGWNGRVRGVFSFREQFRDKAQSSIDSFREKGYHLSVLTGDYAARGAMLERTLHVDVHAELLPGQKLAVIRDLRRQHGPVIMVGDGINDAPALAEADVGIAMGCGADIARDSADLCLLGNDLAQIEWSIDLAKQTMRTVRQNLFWAFSYNTIGIVLAAIGLLNPIWSTVAMVGSSLFVISNSLRLSGSQSLERKESEQSPEVYGPIVSPISSGSTSSETA
ncbi:MAG: cation-translocating P-type ATPase [Planctomycetaceae bacterium]|nr:cation-translocating P-type ATPase [Planctomycetales bacterium]MCB9924748.1 cation-translocating P-type ATPase [Planctomycetaceae bacterium]